MTLEQINRMILTPGLAVLPAAMDTRPARAMLLAIGLQESRFEHRRQLRRKGVTKGPWGPARGFWQFEKNGGLAGVLSHPASRVLAREICAAWRVSPLDRKDLHETLATHDPLACGLARLLLYTLPNPLPGPAATDEAWRQYVAAWRPGAPQRETWDAFYLQAWTAVGIISPIYQP
jgi:hypothetical protein